MTAYEQIEALVEELEDAAECRGIDREGGTRAEIAVATMTLDAARQSTTSAGEKP